MTAFRSSGRRGGSTSNDLDDAPGHLVGLRGGTSPEPHWRLEALTKTLRTATKQLAGHRSTIVTRKKIARLARLAPRSFAVKRHDAQLGGVPCRWFLPRAQKTGPIFMHVHGGGFSICSVKHTHDLFVSDLARHTGLRCVGIDYRLAPEHPFPLPIDDCVAAYLALLDEGCSPSDIILSGDSAGGNLVIAAVLRLREAGKPLPRALVLMSPWVDLELRGETVDRHEHSDYLCREVLENFVDAYLQGADPTQPLASPCYADFADFPPMLIQVGGAEAMLSEVRYLACRAQSHGVAVELQEWPGMIHAWHGFGMVLPEAHSAFRAIGHYVGGLELPAESTRTVAVDGVRDTSALEAG
jgi:acetyl esterase/lipase